MNYLSQVFTEAFLSAFIIPASAEITLSSLIGFGHEQVWLYAAIASVGALIGQSLNLGLGYLLGRAYRKQQGEALPTGYTKMAFYIQQYLWPLLALCMLPMVNVLILLAAFSGLSARKALPVVILGCVGYYVWQTFH